MLKLTVKVGEGVEIGPDVFVRVEQKSGNAVRLAIAALAHVAPIKIVPTGLIPPRIALGLAGEVRHIPRNTMAADAAA